MRITFQKEDQLSHNQKSLLQDVVPKRIDDAKKEGETLPLAFVYDSVLNKAIVIGMGWQTADDKDKCAEMLRQTVRETKADSILFTAEVHAIRDKYITEWTLGLEEGQWDSVGAFPKSEDAMSFMLETEKGAWSAIVFLSDLGDDELEIEFQTSVHYEGRFANLLSPRLV